MDDRDDKIQAKFRVTFTTVSMIDRDTFFILTKLMENCRLQQTACLATVKEHTYTDMKP